MSAPAPAPAKINLSWKGLASGLRQLASIVGLVVAIGNTDHMPTSMRVVLTAVSGSILTAEHYAAAQAPAATVNVHPVTPIAVTAVNPTTESETSP